MMKKSAIIAFNMPELYKKREKNQKKQFLLHCVINIWLRKKASYLILSVLYKFPLYREYYMLITKEAKLTESNHTDKITRYFLELLLYFFSLKNALTR